jgi:hypothetical protein
MARTTQAPDRRRASYRTDGSIDRRFLDPAQVFAAGEKGELCCEDGCGAPAQFYLRHPRSSGKGTRHAFACGRHLRRLTSALVHYRAASTPLGRRA